MRALRPGRSLYVSFLAIILVGNAAAEVGCVGYKFKQGYGVRTGTETHRVSPKVEVRYPAGVSNPMQSTVTYPAGTTRDEAIRDYLVRAHERGAGWVSKLQAYTLSQEHPCAMPLLPPSVAQEHDATYLKEETYAGGAADYSFSTRRESYDVPFVRKLDDLDSILDDIDIWTSRQRKTCVFDPNVPIEISAGIHGRTGIGVRKGPSRLDLRECVAVASSGGDVVSDPADDTTVLLLGNIRAMDVADAILPGWVHSRVLLELADKKVQGVLTRYVNGNLSVQGDDGEWTYAHVMDAKGIVLLELAQGAPAAAPVVRSMSGGSTAPTPTAEDCKSWRPEVKHAF
ncbi:MAG: hypothetical protein EP329_27065 [Deltaproteobacteria bacterium]|nr:MAG: hypothetical protein EP329_27065 [Deltaproteobacteria bacterium]